MNTEKVSLLIGILITAILGTISFRFLSFRNTIDSQREKAPFFEAMESMHYRYNDLKLRLRDPHRSDAKVALLAIDDASLQEIGRWPWSREIVAEMTQKMLDLGAASVSFDVIFAEPEKGAPESDAKLGEVIEKNADKIVLGTFNESHWLTLPYQETCVAEAFLATGGDQLVKINPTFIVDDSNSSPFPDFDWTKLFSPLFEAQKSERQNEILAELGKSDVSQLSPFQLNYLAAQKRRAVFDYCHVWLTPQDPLPLTEKNVAEHYKSMISEDKSLKEMELDTFIARLKNESPKHPMLQYGEWTPNIPVLQNPATYTSSFVAKLDPDGYVRRYPLFFRTGNKLGTSYVPSTALQAYLLATGYRADVKIASPRPGRPKIIQSFDIIDPSTDPEKLVMRLPVDASGQMLVNYYGPQASFPVVSARELFREGETIAVLRNSLQGKEGTVLLAETKEKRSEFFKGRNVIVGATAIGLYDLRNTPIEANYPGPEIHMTALANLLDQNFLRSWKNEVFWMPAILIVIGLILSALFAWMGSLQPAIISGLLIPIAAFVDFFAFKKLQVVTSGESIPLTILFVYMGITIFKYFTEEKKKKELKKTFSRYVSPAIVDELLKDPGNLKLGGRRQHMTVMFSDVRGFTTISEKLPPEELSNLLNRYLSPMTEIVFQHKGTLDKYMGDAIMAFFGAPITYPDHARLAVRCALESLVKLRELQALFASEGLPPIDIGIGINTGSMSVGNMGSNIVQSYTVMGDSVNLASRLEGINKEYGTRIIISEFTQAEVKEHFITREVDRVRVKGKLEPIRIFEVLKEAPPSQADEETVLFGRCYELYHAKKFAEALEGFKRCLELKSDDPVAELYVERCQDYLTEPPPADWDGVHVMKTK